MIKSTLNQRLSLRCKLKDSNTIEICVIETATGTIYLHQLKFRISDEDTKPVEEGELDDMNSDSHKTGLDAEKGEEDEDD